MSSRERRGALSVPTEELPPDDAAGPSRPELRLTILHHPDPARVGDRAVIPAGGVSLSRTAPDFEGPGGGDPWPLGDGFISRTPIHLSGSRPVTVRRPGEAATLAIDGAMLAGERALASEAIARGVVLELGGRVVLLLHEAPPHARVTNHHGLLGESAAIHALRRTIEQVAPTPVPVLLRGETGSGKELVAQALHRASNRASGPCLAVNLAAVGASVAASELFGHARGAFTGATADHEGFFTRADGGTLFLDEIGEAPIEVQVMLLRTLETGLARPVGGRDEARVDVRLVTATDADLARAAEEGRFRPALLHRLAGYEIHLPPLRARKDDLGILLLAFLRDELGRLGASDKLDAVDPRSPWLTAAVVARLARYDWPGNVRQLRNVARHIAISGRDAASVPLDASLERLLALGHTAPTPQPAPVEAPSARRRPSDVSEEELLAALKRNRFRLEPTAAELRITRPSLYMLIDKSTRLRKAKDIPKDELLALAEELGGDVDAMAERLEVSSRGLYLRLREIQRGT